MTDFCQPNNWRASFNIRITIVDSTFYLICPNNCNNFPTWDHQRFMHIELVISMSNACLDEQLNGTLSHCMNEYVCK